MSYIVQRNHRFYVVDYNGHDPISGSERRRWHPAGTSRADAEAIRDRIDTTRPAAPCPSTVAGFLNDVWLQSKGDLTDPERAFRRAAATICVPCRPSLERLVS